jgi:hypothetical protein
MAVATLVHSIPSPANYIQHGGLAPQVTKQLLAHGAFALLTQIGGDELRPVERLLFLYKVAAGLCLQGGIGVALTSTARVFPGALMRDLFGGSLSSKEGTIWDGLRQHGEPAEVLVTITRVEVSGRRYLATCGAAHCGVPDLMWEYTTPEEAREVSQMFRNCFCYMMAKGPVIKAGHTMGYDQNVAYRFEACPAELKPPYPTGEVLIVKKQTKPR